MNELTMLACAVCVIALILGMQDGWPWWATVPLALGAAFFFLAETDED